MPPTSPPAPPEGPAERRPDENPRAGDLVVGEDGRARCAWGAGDPRDEAYHDGEWGRPVRDGRALFEKLCLEVFQAGLSWSLILRKREAFRSAFAGFDPQVVAGFDEADVTRLLGDAGIVRNRAKIAATIANARAALALDGALSDLVWSFAPPPGPPPARLDDVPPSTPASAALAAELRRRGFRFVGPTTVYAFMQAMGLVNDHLAGCAVGDEIRNSR